MFFLLGLGHPLNPWAWGTSCAWGTHPLDTFGDLSGNRYAAGSHCAASSEFNTPSSLEPHNRVCSLGLQKSWVSESVSFSSCLLRSACSSFFKCLWHTKGLFLQKGWFASSLVFLCEVKLAGYHSNYGPPFWRPFKGANPPHKPWPKWSGTSRLNASDGSDARLLALLACPLLLRLPSHPPFTAGPDETQTTGRAKEAMWLWLKTNGIPVWGRCTTHFRTYLSRD